MRWLAILGLVLCSCPTLEPAVLCSDGRVNGAETDLDCGGPCRGCPPGQLCLADRDCASGVCSLNRCVAPSCMDGVMNGGEQGIDCGGGACPPCAGACAPPLLPCGGACVDPRVDRAHCGGCNQPCPPAQACMGSMCQLVCTGGTQSCGAACVDVASDPQHCGSCPVACAPGDLCVGGSCFPRCGAGQTDCGGVCVSIDRDPLHCGGCGRPCALGSGCLGGQCTPGCMPPLLACDGGACVDPRFDPMNCGACGAPCPPVPHAKPACTPVMGCTRSACDPGFADCDAGTNDGCEAELQVDRQNCGMCGRACFGPQSCVLGRCCEPLPPGSYQMTCSGCEACNGQLTCLCDDAMQIPRATSIPLGPCPPMGFSNCNGVLSCNGC